MDFVDEQHVRLLQVGQQRREIAGARDHRARGRAKADAELTRHDLRERRFTEAGRTGEQDVIEWLVTPLGRGDEHAQVVADRRLADELVEPLRAQVRLGRVLGLHIRRDNSFRRHRPNSLRPPLMRSSTGTS